MEISNPQEKQLKNDLKKPLRGKNRNEVKFKLKDCYPHYVKNAYIRHFKSSFIESTPTAVSYNVYRQVLEFYFSRISEFIVEESGVFTLPFKLGNILVEKKKMPIGFLHSEGNLKLDYGIFRKTGKKVFHLNEHRRGYRYKFKWDKRGSGPIICKTVYRYIPTRTMKRRLAQILKTDFSKDYLEC